MLWNGTILRNNLLLRSLILIPVPIFTLDSEVDDNLVGVGVEARRIGFLGVGAVRAIRTSCEK